MIITYSEVALIFSFFSFSFYLFTKPGNIGLRRSRKKARCGSVDWLFKRGWPLQDLITLLRGGHTACTISPTSIYFSSRSTTLLSRRRRAISRLVNVLACQGARSFQNNLIRKLPSSCGPLIVENNIAYSHSDFWFLKCIYSVSVMHQCSSLKYYKCWCLCVEVRAHSALWLSHDDTWPVLTGP